MLGLQELRSLALEHRLCSCGPGIELVSPALADGFFSTEPPGKPLLVHFVLLVTGPSPLPCLPSTLGCQLHGSRGLSVVFTVGMRLGAQ